jgi:ADP-heptose:LPS heptosyltransferase
VLARRLLEAGHRVLAIGGPGEERVLERLATLAPGTSTLRAPDVAALAGRDRAARGARRHRQRAAPPGDRVRPAHVHWFGPAHPGAWTPDDPRHGYWRTSLPCRACERTVCPHWNCLPALTPEEAAARVLEHRAT